MKAIFFSICLFATSYFLAQPAWDHKFDFNAIEKMLESEPIAHIALMQKKAKKERRKHLYFVALKNGVKAVFKTGWYKYGEVAAYKASEAIGLHMVPPTVLRMINGMEGSLQFFVPTSLNTDKQKYPDYYFNLLDQKQISDMHIFYFVFGQWDNHIGNVIITEHEKRYYLALIDNAGMYMRQHIRYGEFPFVVMGHKNPRVNKPRVGIFPFEQVKNVTVASYQQIHDILSRFVEADYINKFFKKNKQNSIYYAIWDNALWVRRRKQKPNFTKVYYASTLDAYKKLTRETLRHVWSDVIKTDPIVGNELVELTLIRRDQLMAAAFKEGIIHKDLKQ